MAEFCEYCSKLMWNEELPVDLAGLSTEEDTLNGLVVSVLCEGCGEIEVDHTGKCLTHSEDEHRKIWRLP